MRRVPRVLLALVVGAGMIATIHHGAKRRTDRMPDITRRGLMLAAGAVAAGFAAPAASVAAPAASISGTPEFRLGIVTYMIAADWDVPTILRVCRSVGIGDVELRTTHKHGVEPSLSKDQRQSVRKQFADAGVAIWGLGSTC